VQRNAYCAVRNNEKARTHELGRSHRYQRKSTAPNALGSSSVGMPTVDHLCAICLRFGLLPKLGPCPWQVIRCLSRAPPIRMVARYCDPVTTGHFWQPDCEYEVRIRGAIVKLPKESRPCSDN